MKRGRHKTSMEWPVAVDERLRLLVALAGQAQGSSGTSASELVATLICEQPLDGPMLAARVAMYRQVDPVHVAAVTCEHAVLGAAPRRGRPRGTTRPGPR